MKLKVGTTQKRCPDGELYKFKNGIAEVPGMRFCGKKVFITLAEFNELCEEVRAEKDNNSE